MFCRNRSHQSTRALAEVTPPPSARAARLWGDSFGGLATRALQLIIIVIAVGAALWGLSILSTVAIPFVLAIIFASTFEPVMSWLRRKKVPPIVATILVFVTVIGLFALISYLVVNAVANQWGELQQQAQDGFKQVARWVHDLPYAPSSTQIEEWKNQAIDFLTSSKFGSGALAGVGAVTNVVTGAVLTMVMLFFFLKDGPQIWNFVTRPFRGEAGARVDRIGEKAVKTLGAYVRGTASVAAVDALGIGLGLVILQVPLALPLAVLVFLFSFIPIVGAVIAGVLAALVALVSNGLVSALLVIGVVVLVNQLEGNLLQPVLMGRALKLHALAILLALTIGTVVANILGAVLAVPIAAVIWGAIQVWDGPDLPARWARPTPEHPVPGEAV